MNSLKFGYIIEGEQGATLTVDYVGVSGPGWKKNGPHSKEITLPRDYIFYRGEIDLANNGRVPNPFLTVTNTSSEPLRLLLYGERFETLADGHDYSILAILGYNANPLYDVSDSHKMTLDELYRLLEESNYTGYRELAPGETGTVTIPAFVN